MPATRLGTYELRRFKGPLPKIAIIFLICIPLLYGALYLWSNWDPYGRLDSVPVAVVNLDRPVQADGQTVDAGAQFVAELHDEKIFDWHFTDAADARDGLAEGRYYLTITVPKDFSANLASGAGPNPKRAVLLMHRDDVNGYVIGMLTDSVQTKLENAVDKAAIGTYFQAVFANLDTIRDGMVKAVDGSGRLVDGLDDAAPGAQQLADGLTDAKSGSEKLVSGLNDAKGGAGKLADGAHDAHSGAGTLAAGLDTATDGSQTLSDGLGQLTSGAADLAAGADRVADGNRTIAGAVDTVVDTILPALPKIAKAGTDLTGHVADLTAAVSSGSDSLTARTDAVESAYQQFVNDHPDLADDPALAALGTAVTKVADTQTDISGAAGAIAGDAAAVHDAVSSADDPAAGLEKTLKDAKSKVDQLADGADQVASGAHTLHTKLADADTGGKKLATGIADADTGAHQLVGGLADLSSGAKDLRGGVTKLANGATTLDTGLGTLSNGAGNLRSGVDELDDGAQQLHGALADGVDRLPVLTPDQQHDAAQVLSSPADVHTTIDHPANKYGRGLAPFFFAIAIWVFGISAFLVLKPISGRALAGRARASRLAMAGYLPVAGMATVGSLILLLVSWFGLGLDPVHVAASFGVVILAALCFSAIAHVLRTALGTVGSAITLVLLMVQLTSCGGLYPIETLPAPLRAIHPYIPMSYLVDGLRITFTGGPAGHLWRDVAVLAGFTLAALGACIWVVARRKRFSIADLHPVLA